MKDEHTTAVILEQQSCSGRIQHHLVLQPATYTGTIIGCIKSLCFHLLAEHHHGLQHLSHIGALTAHVIVRYPRQHTPSTTTISGSHADSLCHFWSIAKQLAKIHT